MKTEFQTILCPVDLSALSAAALPLGMAVARKYGARLLLAHVVDDRFPYPDAFAWVKPAEDFYKAMRKSALEQMRKLARDHDAGGIELERVVRQGAPHEEILLLAEERGVDLIVMSTHGRSGLDHALIGSQAEKILRRAACPVLTVRPERG